MYSVISTATLSHRCATLNSWKQSFQHITNYKSLQQKKSLSLKGLQNLVLRKPVLMRYHIFADIFPSTRCLSLFVAYQHFKTSFLKKNYLKGLLVRSPIGVLNWANIRELTGLFTFLEVLRDNSFPCHFQLLEAINIHWPRALFLHLLI